MTPRCLGSRFATLVSTIAHGATSGSKVQRENIFEDFVSRIKRSGPLSQDTGPILFRLLFPEEDSNRKYGLQETALSRQIMKYLRGLGLGEPQILSVRDWAGQSNKTRTGRSGCLGEELGHVLRSRSLVRTIFGVIKPAYALLQSSPKYRATLRDVDVLLDELARLCRFSQLPLSPSDSPPGRSQLTILTDLYNLASPDDAAIITQIVLKDLRPLLHPLEVIHTTRNLLKQRAPSNPLNVWEAMRIWNPELPRIYKICSNITEAFRVIDGGMPPTLEPVLGAPIQVGHQSAYLETRIYLFA